jgi:hypothetical protein
MMMEDCRDRIVLSSGRVDHSIVGRPRGPIDAEVMLNKGTPFAVHCLDESGVGFILTVRDKPPDFSSRGA